MAITKTNFINYVRCPRYVALDNLKKEKLDSFISLDDYLEEDKEDKIKELLNSMYDDDTDLIDILDEHLEVMLPYYNKVEILAGNLCSKYFKGTFKYSKETKEQESFDCKINGIRYLCYVDIYNEVDDYFNIIEVKATTSKKFLEIGPSYIDKEGNKKINPIFEKINNIYYLKKNTDKKYLTKLFDSLDKSGHYVYDLAVQRYIIENDLKQNNNSSKIDKINYYLAVLNHEYVFDGNYNLEEPVYEKDINNEEIITYFDLTDITKEYLKIIDNDRQKIESYIKKLDGTEVKIGPFCEHKKTTVCKYQSICWKNILKTNSILNYINASFGFKDSNNQKYDLFELLNNGIIKMTDIPYDYLNRDKNKIQYEVTKNHKPYVDKAKIKSGIAKIKYPIYHLDFETFPCPLPRYKGEKCYSQSVFQFSLHIEQEPGLCDKNLDHYGFLAKNHEDLREELVKELTSLIKEEGTVLVYNESFEKGRLKELASIFPQYKTELLHIRSMVFDLMNILKSNTKLYQELGYDLKLSKMFNYYHEDMKGSFSIKKILPLFSNLTYKNMEIGNGVEALVTYAKFPTYKQEKYNFKYEKLIEYCKQDTWAMVEILWGLKSFVK